ncbi:MAG: ABC transporter permease [Anaerolineae bacterium]|nr:ABC transporter permease [Anaerolineae bacterium]
MARQAVHITKKSTPKQKKRPTVPFRWLRRLTPLLTMLMVLGFWQVIVLLEIYPRFIIPAPLEVWDSFVEVARDGTLLRHVSVTLYEMLVGLLLGVTFGLFLGFLIAKNTILDEMLSPIVVAFQATPVVAYAPLLIIWFGSGVMSKIITTAIIVFFPTLMNVVVGLRNVPQNLRELMRSMKATSLQTFFKLEVPAALPVMLTGLKTSATLAVIGAVVGEFVGASEGLGFLVISARSRFDTPLVLVTVFTMTALALSFYLLISLLERALLRWQRHSH